MAQIEIEMHKHHKMHGGAIGFIDAFKNLGNTKKSGFEDKIINPIKSGVEEKIINPIKENIPKSEKDLLDKIPDKIKNDPKFAKAIDYITKKKGGLSSSLLHNALPATTSAIVGGLTGLATGNPLLGMAGSAAGGYAGKELSDYIGNKTGVGIRKGKGMGPRIPTGADAERYYNISGAKKTPSIGGSIKKRIDVPINDVGYIPTASGSGINKLKQRKSISKEKQSKKKKYYYSSDSESSSDDEKYNNSRPKNSALQQLIEGHRVAEAKELKKGQLMLTQHQVEEMKLLRNARPLQKVGKGIKKLIGTKRGNSVRGDIVAEVMKKQGLSLSQASKYVKEHDLY
jgi:hypothetical protein